MRHTSGMGTSGGMLEGKATAIIGASSGIGAAAARLFAEEGARLVLAARRVDRLEELRQELVAKGHEVEVVKADMASFDEIRGVVDRTVEVYGRIDCAFNNGGMTYLGGCAIADSTEEEVIHLIDVNLIGVWRCLSAEIQAMRLTGGGSVVNTSSVGGFHSGPKLGPYPASKHGVIGLTVQAAADHGRDGIRINCLAPGGTDTEMMDVWAEVVPEVRGGRDRNPLGRIGQAIEMAEAACWMLSDRASYVSGSVLKVDGGMLA
jgi:NAD(P)-dependent dehydrogenase (short-subunit alcohol dehydrogenase family)